MHVVLACSCRTNDSIGSVLLGPEAEVKGAREVDDEKAMSRTQDPLLECMERVLGKSEEMLSYSRRVFRQSAQWLFFALLCSCYLLFYPFLKFEHLNIRH